MWLFLLFVAVPIVEIALFIQVGGAIGLWPTLGIVVLTALIGTALVRVQGLATLAQLQRSIEAGTNPTRPIAHGALILVAGVLLLTPGFFTDAVGLGLLVPPVRDALIRIGAERLATRVHVVGARQTRPGAADDDVVDADYTVEEPQETPRKGPSGWTKPD